MLWEKVGSVMSQTPPQVDERLEKVNEVAINFSTFKKALKRNYLGEATRRDRSYVLRLYPPFEAEMGAEYYESRQGVHYDSNWDEEPFHIAPELLVLEGGKGEFRSIVDWEDSTTIGKHRTDDEIQEAGGKEAVLNEAHEMFWDELKTVLPETFDLGRINNLNSYEVKINWVFDDQ